MTRCPDHARIQDHLEGLLAPAELRAWLSHLAGCDACRVESLRVQRLFSVLVDLPLVEPAPALTDRILARVLPSTARHRWLVRFGWGYAAAFAACIAAVSGIAMQPASRSFLAWLSSEASGRVLGVLGFLMHAASFAAVNLASGWRLLTGVGSLMEPVARAVVMLLGQPAVGLALIMAAGSCVALFLWLKPPSGGRGKGVRHVGLLGI